ncbi:MAG TPA: hypothetical protein PKA64_01630 [Myxococcota bacterium]|nr:hypothetical protein [Myxococcota bacterium]
MIAWHMVTPAGEVRNPDGTITVQLDLRVCSVEFALLFWRAAWSVAGWRLLHPRYLLTALGAFVEAVHMGPEDT